MSKMARAIYMAIKERFLVSHITQLLTKLYMQCGGNMTSNNCIFRSKRRTGLEKLKHKEKYSSL